MKKLLSTILASMTLLSLPSCAIGSSSKLSPEERFIRQAKENAQNYISDKYGFEASASDAQPLTDDTYDFPLEYKPGEDAKVTLKYNGETFNVIISGKENSLDGKDSYQYQKINDDMHEFITKEIGDPVFTGTLPFEEIDSVPTTAFFRPKSEYYDGNNLSKLLKDYDFCCIEVFGRDLSDEAAYKSIVELFSETSKYFELCIVSYKNEDIYNTHPIYLSYTHEGENERYDKLDSSLFKANQDKIKSYRRYFGDGTSEYVSFDKEPASETAETSSSERNIT